MSSRDNLNVLGKIQKCKTFSVPIEKDIANIEKDGNERHLTK